MAWLTDWLSLLARWFHLIVGAGWIGTSFYFNWLNNNVRPVDDDETGELAGALWSVHGGAFYQVRKIKGAPRALPETLHWFKWEAYLTWISGVSLLLLVYWMQAGTSMVPPGSDLAPWAAASIGVGSLALGWVVYDLLCRSPLSRHPRVFAALGFSLLCAAAWGLSELLSPRAAYIHVGAMVGTMMALNVFFVIIPGQKKMVDALLAGREPEIDAGAAGSLRSLHNNYFTLPVLFIMVSNHFPFTYGHTWGWAVLAGIALLGSIARHAFNLMDRGQDARWILPVAALGMMGLAFVSHGPRPSVEGAEVPGFAEVGPIIEARCVGCHAETPTFEGIAAPPLGLLLETPEQIRQAAPKIQAQAVDTQTMPLGNVTGMTDQERAVLGAWIAGGAPL